ncbi:GNAT family N-acetyltransferase [Massilia sp. GCM10020059]|uniref:GNAT family N-acetyltransferase n=1 Tax=Massilia agrisoli TaxID=2892444 RepID=A0ABS8IV46_9BURK|nr:GNAT family N-acetyltransferase [Massilia agrisoli]MCC6072330.1 GNAT family N-acetyltransferase [Massilia agrisoli]
MRLRDMNDADIGAVARLLEALARQYFLGACSPEQASTFVRDNDAAALRRLVGEGYVYHVAEVDGQLAGFIGVRERRHVYHLFVAAQFHRRGIGRALWEHARLAAMAAGAEGVFTVNASNYAVPMYESLKFVRAAPMQCKNGLEFNPMVFGQSAASLVSAA